VKTSGLTERRIGDYSYSHCQIDRQVLDTTVANRFSTTAYCRNQA